MLMSESRKCRPMGFFSTLDFFSEKCTAHYECKSADRQRVLNARNHKILSVVFM